MQHFHAFHSSKSGSDTVPYCILCLKGCTLCPKIAEIYTVRSIGRPDAENAGNHNISMLIVTGIFFGPFRPVLARVGQRAKCFTIMRKSEAKRTGVGLIVGTSKATQPSSCQPEIHNPRFSPGHEFKKQLLDVHYIHRHQFRKIP